MRTAEGLKMGKKRLTVILTCLWAAFAIAAVTSAAVAQGLAADMPCGGTTADGWIAACTAMIESSTLHGRPLAGVYSQRGYAFTLKRNLAQAKKDLDEAIKIDPQFAQAFVNRA